MQCDLTGNIGVNEIDKHPKKYHQRWIDSIVSDAKQGDFIRVEENQ